MRCIGDSVYIFFCFNFLVQTENASGADSNETRNNVVAGTEIEIESNEFAVQNDCGLTVLLLEFACINILRIIVLLFSQLDQINTGDSTQWFWQEFDVSYIANGLNRAGYTLHGTLLLKLHMDVKTHDIIALIAFRTRTTSMYIKLCLILSTTTIE